jgi:uncharacterized phage protein (TIGR01671 family)
MREIKFRAWSKKEKRMFDVVFINFSEGYCMESEKKAHYFQQPINNTVLMQFTSLTGKNGVEIYEGDIIKYYDSFFQSYIIGQVVFQDGTLCLTPDKEKKEKFWTTITLWDDGMHHWHSLEMMWEQDIEVIGNIYENPELLTQA